MADLLLWNTPGVSEETPATPAKGGIIAVAVGVMNVATYGFTILAARQLGPREYGAFAAVMNLLIVVSVAQLALQATAARRISAAPGDVGAIEAGVRRLTWRAALALGVVLLAAAPAVNVLLRLDSIGSSLLVGLIAIPLTLMGGLAGILQGERRWAPLAAVYVAAGVPRLAVGVGLILWRPEEFTALVAVLVGAVAPVVVGQLALRTRPAPSVAASNDLHTVRELLREAARNSHALLAFFAVSNVDIIVARNVLDDHDAGLYAGGLILTKAMLFLPQFVVVLAFPAMSTPEQRRRALRLSLGLVLVLGVVGTLAAWLLSDLAIVFVGGAAYDDIASKLPLFAVLGTVLSMIQMLVYALLARQARRSVLLIWVPLLVIAGAAPVIDSVAALVLLVSAVDAVLFIVLLGLVLLVPADDEVEAAAV